MTKNSVRGGRLAVVNSDAPMSASERRADAVRQLREDVRGSGHVCGWFYRHVTDIRFAGDLLAAATMHDHEEALFDAQDEGAKLAVDGNAQRAGYVEWFAWRHR